jgi:gluconolactonase
MRTILLLTILTLPLSAQTPRPTLGTIERLDPALDALIPPGSTLEVLASGRNWSEGPVWDKANKRLLFSDVPENTIFQWSEKDGLAVYMTPSGFTGPAGYGREPGSNGLAFDKEGRLLCCEHGDRRISVLTKDGGKRTVADNFEGKRFNSPNDLAVHPDGSIYFTDPPYGLPEREKDPKRETDWFGVYRIAPDGTVSLEDKTLQRPNGIALSHDGKHAFVAQSHGPAPIIKKYNIQADGSLDAGTTLFNTKGLNGSGAPDGLKIDQAGNVWTTGPGGVLIISPEGKLLGRILTGQNTANCAWGDDGSTLYVTADAYICRIKTKSKGAGW